MEDNPTVEDEDPTASNPLLTSLSKETPEVRKGSFDFHFEIWLFLDIRQQN